jgi:hypothetical protein
MAQTLPDQNLILMAKLSVRLEYSMLLKDWRVSANRDIVICFQSNLSDFGMTLHSLKASVMMASILGITKEIKNINFIN